MSSRKATVVEEVRRIQSLEVDKLNGMDKLERLDKMLERLGYERKSRPKAFSPSEMMNRRLGVRYSPAKEEGRGVTLGRRC